MPAGIVMHTMSTVVPDGWLVLGGQFLDPDDYPELFAAIGYVWGGTSPGNFRLPDMFNHFIGGGTQPQHVGVEGGLSNTVLETQNLPPHSHTINAGTSLTAPAGVVPTYTVGPLPLHSTNNQGSATPFTNVPPNFKMIAIVSTGQ